MSETTAEDCKKLEEEATAAQEELKQCRAKRRELVEEIRTLTKLIKSLSVKLPQLEMEIAGFDTTREELTKRLPSLREQSTLSASDEKKKCELLEKVEQCKLDMASCVETTSKLEKEVSTLQKNIINAGGPKLKNQQKACEKAKKDLNDASKELNAAKSTISTCKKVITKSEKARATAEEELETSKAALDQMKEEHEKLTTDAKELLEAYEAVKVVEAEKRKALESVSKESDKIKQEQTKLKCAEVELTAKIENLDKQIKDSERKVAHWQKEIHQLVKLERQEDIDYDLSDDEDEEEDDDENMDGGAEETKEEDDVMVEDNEMANDDVVEEIKTESDANAPKKKSKMSSSLPTLSDASLEQYSIESIKNDIAVLEKERDTLAKNANMGAIAEYRKKEADYLSR
jgi:structural maintenance of chromosome 4